MRHPIRSAVVAGATALLMAGGAGTASAQGSLQFALPFPLDLPGLSSLMTGPGAQGAVATETHAQPLVVVPADVARTAFEGSIVAGVNEARTAVGAERLVTDAALADEARVRAEQLAAVDPAADDPATAKLLADESRDRSELELAPEATPPNVLTALLTDPTTRDRMLDSDFTHVGVGTATDEAGEIHIVLEFAAG